MEILASSLVFSNLGKPQVAWSQWRAFNSPQRNSWRVSSVPLHKQLHHHLHVRVWLHDLITLRQRWKTPENKYFGICRKRFFSPPAPLSVTSRATHATEQTKPLSQWKVIKSMRNKMFFIHEMCYCYFITLSRNYPQIHKANPTTQVNEFRAEIKTFIC